MEPIYAYEDPETHARWRAMQAHDLGCSDEYVERLRADVLMRTVQVRDAFAANALQKARRAEA